MDIQETTVMVVVDEPLPPLCPKCRVRAERWLAARLRNRLALHEGAAFGRAMGLQGDGWEWLRLIEAAGWRPDA